MTNSTHISTILDHLAWLKKQLGIKINRSNARPGALLAYNAAAQLQWKFVFPTTDQDRVADAAARNRAAKLIDDFVWEVRGLHEEAKNLDASGHPNSTATKDLLDRLSTQLTQVLRKLPKIIGLPIPRPVRDVDLERELRTEELVGEWVQSRRGYQAAIPTGSSAPELRSNLLSTMAGAIFVQHPQQVAAAVRATAASADIVAAFISLAVEQHVQGLPPRSAERTTVFSHDVQTHLTARTSP